MNTAAKLLVAMRQNPLDWQLAQLQTVAKQHGIDWRHDGGSHCVFVRNLTGACKAPDQAGLCEEVSRTLARNVTHEQAH